MQFKNQKLDWELRDAASETCILQVCQRLRIAGDDGYRAFLAEYDGGEGFLGENYLILWSIDELEQFNLEYEVEKHARGIVLFGSSGGGEGYGFDTRVANMPVVQIPFIVMDLEYAEIVGADFNDFIQRLAKKIE